MKPRRPQTPEELKEEERRRHELARQLSTSAFGTVFTKDEERAEEILAKREGRPAKKFIPYSDIRYPGRWELPSETSSSSPGSRPSSQQEAYAKAAEAIRAREERLEKAIEESRKEQAERAERARKSDLEEAKKRDVQKAEKERLKTLEDEEAKRRVAEFNRKYVDYPFGNISKKEAEAIRDYYSDLKSFSPLQKIQESEKYIQSRNAVLEQEAEEQRKIKQAREGRIPSYNIALEEFGLNPEKRKEIIEKYEKYLSGKPHYVKSIDQYLKEEYKKQQEAEAARPELLRKKYEEDYATRQRAYESAHQEKQKLYAQAMSNPLVSEAIKRAAHSGEYVPLRTKSEMNAASNLRALAPGPFVPLPRNPIFFPGMHEPTPMPRTEIEGLAAALGASHPRVVEFKNANQAVQDYESNQSLRDAFERNRQIVEKQIRDAEELKRKNIIPEQNIENRQQAPPPRNRPLLPFYNRRPGPPIINYSNINRQQRFNFLNNEPIEENPETPLSQQPQYFDESEGARIPASSHLINRKLAIVRPIENNPNTPYNEQPQYFDEVPRFAHGGAVMNPALLEMSRQQQEPVNNPIMNGANAGMQSARNSMRMGDEDRNRAMGLAVMHFGRHMANPAIGGPGFAGALGRAAQSMGPATDAYMDYEQNAIKHNILAQQLEDQRLQNERQERLRRDEMEMREKLGKEKLSELNRYHTGMLNKEDRLTKDERMYNIGQKKTEELQNEYPGAVAFETMNPAAQRQISQELRALGSKGKEYSKMLHNLDELERIIDKHPELSDTMTAAWYPEGEGIIKSRIRSGMPKEERFAIERSNKLIKDILANKIQSVSSKTSTDVFKRILGDTLPSTRRNMDKANKAVINDLRNEFKPMHDYIKMTPKMLSKGFYVPMPVPEPEDYVDYNESNVSTSRTGAQPNPISIIDDELARIDAQLAE